VRFGLHRAEADLYVKDTVASKGAAGQNLILHSCLSSVALPILQIQTIS
jgi:hypothetical protein